MELPSFFPEREENDFVKEYYFTLEDHATVSLGKLIL